MLCLVDKPQRASCRHDQTKGIGPDEAWPFATLILAQTIEGPRIADFDFHGPAVAILVQDVVGTQGKIGGEQGFDGWGWFSLPRLFGGEFARTPQHDDPHEAPRQHRMPQAIPGLNLGARFAGVG